MGPKVTRQANTTRKNLLGRTVSVERKQQGNEPVSKTRTVISKNGGVISTKTSYKDGNSIAGKMRSNKIDKINDATPPKIQIKRSNTNNYPEKFTKEKYLAVSIKRKNKPDIEFVRGMGKNKDTGEKSVTRMTTKINKDGKRNQNRVVIKKDASGNKTKKYFSFGGSTQEGHPIAATHYIGSDKSLYREAKKNKRGAGPILQKRIKMESKPR